MNFDYLPWITLALLGAYHGLNPGMGWLFAVALGLQERSRAAVIRAFVPIALGHAASVAVVVALVAAVQTVIDPQILRFVGAGALISFGLYKLLAPMSHPRWVGMRVNFRDLTAWSFLMATAHGAGLMLVPVLLHLSPAAPAATPARPANHTEHTNQAAHDEVCGHTAHTAHAHHDTHTAHAGHAAHADHAEHLLMVSSAAAMPSGQIAAVGLHTLAMFLVMGGIAIVVYEKIGLAILRRAWFNLDRLWAGALIVAGVLAFVL